MYKLKETAQRVTSLAGALALMLGMSASLIPASASADALNPLTERSLLLSSSSPGFHYLDGSGNTTYAAPNSGPNGKQTGETFMFKNSTDSSSSSPSLKAFTFQYCTTAAGLCTAPGNDARATSAPTARGNDTYDSGSTPGTSDLNAHYTSPVEGTDFDIYVGGTKVTGTDWTMTVGNKENPTDPLDATGKNNLITLTNTASPLTPAAGTALKVVFHASSTNYITNPGSGAFFVKINDYSSATDVDPLTSTHIVDGGVTVANVMTDSIQIQTKVLETMSFSVGTVQPDTVAQAHGGCDAITTNNPINLGDPSAEYSLSPSRAYDGFSYWRLSSNSSNGATVYYSGYTLANTEGDQIDPIYDLASGTNASGDGSAGFAHFGSEQFGLGLDSDADTLDNTPSTGFVTDVANDPSHLVYSNPHLTPLVASTTSGAVANVNYGAANGSIATTDAGARFGFKTASSSTPEALASENSDVIHCSTGKMRYVADIAPDTPAGIYTTKINYLASPEY